MSKLTVKVRSGISADGFETIVTNGDDIVDQRRWDYGYNCSYARNSNDKTPYVTDVLQNLIDRYQVDEFSVEPGKNVFAKKDVRSEKVEEFKKDYCSELQIPGAADEQDFADAVASIPENDGQLSQ